MAWIVKATLLLVVISLIGLAIFTIIGPFFGADFTATPQEIHEPITLDR